MVSWYRTSVCQGLTFDAWFDFLFDGDGYYGSLIDEWMDMYF